jgi:hypothetical protein
LWVCGFALRFFAVFGFARCRGGLFATTSTARSKRCQASGSSSISFSFAGFDMQPLTKVRPTANMFWGDPETMLKRPKAAARVAQCISEWAEIETMIALFLATLLHTESKTALAMYASLENRTAQRRLILAAAKSKLPPDQFDLIEIVFNVSILPVMRERDRLAHWCWGYCDELPNDLLLQSPEEKTEMHYLSVRGKTPKQADNPDMIFVITEKYLGQLAVRTRTASKQLTGFMCSVWDEMTEPERAGFRQRLSNEPQICEALERLSASRQKTPKAPPPKPPKGKSGKR